MVAIRIISQQQLNRKTNFLLRWKLFLSFWRRFFEFSGVPGPNFGISIFFLALAQKDLPALKISGFLKIKKYFSWTFEKRGLKTRFSKKTHPFLNGAFRFEFWIFFGSFALKNLPPVIFRFFQISKKIYY